MASPYPSGFDNFPTDKADASVSATDHHNDLADAINKIQVALGTDPAGGFSTVSARASLALTPFGPDLVTGDSQHFKDGVGDWTEVGAGTISWEDYGEALHPLQREFGSTHFLDYFGVEVEDYLTLPVTGTFEAGRRYCVTLAVAVQNGDDEWLLTIGDPNDDVGTGVLKPHVGGLTTNRVRLLSAFWTPLTDIVDPPVALQYLVGGVGEILVAFCQVAEVLDFAAFPGIAVTSGEGSLLELNEGLLHIHTQSISLIATNEIELQAGTALRIFSGGGVDQASLPALETATTEGEVIAGYNLIRTMLISLGLATDGD